MSGESPHDQKVTVPLASDGSAPAQEASSSVPLLWEHALTPAVTIIVSAMAAIFIDRSVLILSPC